MIYRESEDRPRAELEVDLSAASGEVVAAALLDCASFESADWAVARILGATRDPRKEVVRTALTALGVLARRRELPTDRRIWAALLHALDDPELVGTAEDVMDDLELYGTTGRSSHQAGRESDG